MCVVEFIKVNLIEISRISIGSQEKFFTFPNACQLPRLYVQLNTKYRLIMKHERGVGWYFPQEKFLNHTSKK